MEDTANAGEIVRASIMAQIQREAAQGKRKLSKKYAGESAERGAAPSKYNLFIPIRGDRHLVYNTLTGAFAVWDSNDMAVYNSLKFSSRPVSDPELRDFIGAGYMVSDATDEVAELEQRYMGARQDAATMVMTVAPIMACNFACAYCFQGADKPHKKMTPEVQDALIAYLDQKLPGLTNLNISWYGGEPLMGKDIIESLTHRINELCIKHNVNYSAFVVTNGYFLNGDLAEKLVSLGVTSCQVTLDGDAESHDARRHLLSGRPTYDRIAKNLVEVVNRTNMQVSLRVNIDHHNKDYIKLLMQDLAERGLARRNTLGVYFAPVESITEACHDANDTAMGKSEYAVMEADLYRYAFEIGLTGLPRPPMMHGNCAAVRKNGLVLLPSGELHKCWDTVNDTKMKIGTIFDAEKAFSSAVHGQWMEWSPFNNDTCRNCKILPNCTGACAFKFIYKDKTLGEGGSLPCPSWKFNINERLLIRAEKKGIISADDIIEASATSADQVGQNHSTSGLFQVSTAKKNELVEAIL